MGLTTAAQEQMGRWAEALSAEKRRRPPQVADYASLRSWAISRLLPEAKSDPNGRARLDYVLSAHWLELGPPQPAVVLAQPAPKPVAPRPLIDRSTERWALSFLGGLVLAAIVGAFWAGRTGAIEQVRACYRSPTNLEAVMACPDWALPQGSRP